MTWLFAILASKIFKYAVGIGLIFGTIFGIFYLGIKYEYNKLGLRTQLEINKRIQKQTNIVSKIGRYKARVDLHKKEPGVDVDAVNSCLLSNPFAKVDCTKTP